MSDIVCGFGPYAVLDRTPPSVVKRQKTKSGELAEIHVTWRFRKSTVRGTKLIGGDFVRGQWIVFLGLGGLGLRAQDTGDCQPLVSQSESLYQQGAYAQAEAWHRRALRCQETLLPPGHPDLAESYDRLAELTRLRRQFREAESLLGRALAIWSHNPDLYYAKLADARNGLALVYHEQRRYVEAEVQAREAKAIWEKAHGPFSFGVASTLNTIGCLYSALKDFVAAERNFRLGLDAQKTGGRWDLLTATLIHNIASTRYQMGFTLEAERLYRESLSLQEGLLPLHHPQLAKTREAYVKALKKNGMKAEARLLTKRKSPQPAKTPHLQGIQE